jgi:hypothetical protein
MPGRHFTPARDAYTFWYRPRTERGHTWLTVPELGLSHHHVSRSHLLISPPSLRVHGEQEQAEGIVANFSFDSRFFEALAGHVGLSEIISKRPWHHFFAVDQRIEALCRLLMEETEEQCPNGSLYFEPLARALALRVLGDSARSARPRVAGCGRSAWRSARCSTPGGRVRGRDLFGRTCFHGTDEPQPFCTLVSPVYGLHAASIPAFGAPKSRAQTYCARQSGIVAGRDRRHERLLRPSPPQPSFSTLLRHDARSISLTAQHC